jgi:molybdopterin-binding protein
MDLRQLRYLVALGEEEHFTRAARRLGIAQPALSQLFKRFEAQVGVPLVERSTRSVRLTDAGRMVVAGARRVLREVEALSDELDALRGVRSGRVVIGVTRTPGAVDVVRLLARFADAHPGVELDVREELTVELVSMLEAGALDLALIAEGSMVVPPTLDVRTIAEDPLVAIVPAAHPLAERSDLSIRDLAEQRLVTFHRGATIRTQLEQRAFAGRGRPAGRRRAVRGAAPAPPHRGRRPAGCGGGAGGRGLPGAARGRCRIGLVVLARRTYSNVGRRSVRAYAMLRHMERPSAGPDLSVGEAAAALGISSDTLRRWDRNGRLRTVRDERNQRRVPVSEIERLGNVPVREGTGDQLSTRNRFAGVVRSVQVDGIMALVEIEAGPHRITSVVTRDAVEELGLAPGVPATAMVKSTSVMIERGTTA